MPVPIVRGTGAINSGAGTITLAEPAGSMDGDLQLMFLETDPADSLPTCTGWADTPNSPQNQDSAAATDTRLSILYRIRSGAGTLTTNDPGDHIVGRILGIRAETFDRGNPFNVSAGGTDATADTSASVPGAVTTVKDCLVIAAISSGFDPGANGAAEFSGFTNGNLSSIVEQIDNIRTAGNGGGIGVATGSFTGPGDYGATTATHANASLKGLISLAIAPPPPTALPATKESFFLLMATGGFRKMQRKLGGTVEETPGATTFLPQLIRWTAR